MSFAKNIGKYVNKNLSGKYSPAMFAIRKKVLDHPEQFATDTLKTTSKKMIQRTTEATGDLTGN